MNRPCFDALPDLCHHLQIEVDIVNAGKDGGEDFVGVEKVVDVGPAEVCAGVAVAARVDGVEVAAVVLVGEADPAAAGEEGGAAGIAGRDDAVEHVHAALDAFEDILRQADPHEIAGFVLREKRRGHGDDFFEQFQPFTDRDPADGIAGEIHGHQFPGAHFAQILKDAPLDDAEQRLVFSGLGLQALLPPSGGFCGLTVPHTSCRRGRGCTRQKP